MRSPRLCVCYPITSCTPELLLSSSTHRPRRLLLLLSASSVTHIYGCSTCSTAAAEVGAHRLGCCCCCCSVLPASVAPALLSTALCVGCPRPTLICDPHLRLRCVFCGYCFGRCYCSVLPASAGADTALRALWLLLDCDCCAQWRLSPRCHSASCCCLPIRHTLRAAAAGVTSGAASIPTCVPNRFICCHSAVILGIARSSIPTFGWLSWLVVCAVGCRCCELRLHLCPPLQ